MKTISFSTLLRLLVSLILGLGVSVAQAAALQEITQYAYDANGNLTRIADPLSQPTDHRYDALDRPLATQDALGGQTRYEYDALDRLTTVADPLGLMTRYALDGLGDEREATSPDSGRTQNSYDEAGNRTTTTDARGHTLRYAYDALNRLTRIDAGQGSPIILRYDQGPNAAGRLSSLADESGESTWQYDSLGRVTTHTIKRAEATLKLQYTYDANGRLREIVYPSGQRLELDWQNGLISDLTINGMALLSGIQYRPFGPPSGWEWGNGKLYLRGFDLDGRPLHYPLRQRERQLDYDAASRILGYTDTDPAYSQRFAYDALHRLLQTDNAQSSQSFGYDGNGNRISENGQPHAYARDSNRLQATGSAAYAYDESGNVLSDGHRHFAYDAFGRLQQADNGTTTFQYQYDGFGVRAAKWQGSAPDMAGDIDRDGRFSVLDGRKLVLMAQGELTPAYNADCDHDAGITTQDALCVMGKLVDQRQHP
ncbi:MAG: repeat-associated core protein, partial [Proteobacteria bacterium]|nr:repeat-associated core protein [Pseudomonadota bacterium]